MPKYDAFGREIGEDSLEGLGWTSGGAVPPAPEAPPEPVPRPAPVSPAAPPPVSVSGSPQPPPPTFTAPPTYTPPPPPPPPPAAAMPPLPLGRLRDAAVRPSPPPPRAARLPDHVAPDQPRDLHRDRRHGRAQTIKDATDLNIGIGSDPTPIPFPGIKIGTDGKEGNDAKPPVGLAPRSMIRPAAFKVAIADLKKRKLGQVRNLRLAPERIDTQLLTSGGRLRSVQHTYDGEFRKFSLSGAGFKHLGTIPFAQARSQRPAATGQGRGRAPPQVTGEDQLPGRLRVRRPGDLGGVLQGRADLPGRRARQAHAPRQLESDRPPAGACERIHSRSVASATRA